MSSVCYDQVHIILFVLNNLINLNYNNDSVGQFGLKKSSCLVIFWIKIFLIHFLICHHDNDTYLFSLQSLTCNKHTLWTSKQLLLNKYIYIDKNKYKKTEELQSINSVKIQGFPHRLWQAAASTDVNGSKNGSSAYSGYQNTTNGDDRVCSLTSGLTFDPRKDKHRSMFPIDLDDPRHTMPTLHELFTPSLVVKGTIFYERFIFPCDWFQLSCWSTFYLTVIFS